MKKRKIEQYVFLSIIVILPFLLYGKVLFSGEMLFGTDWLGGAYMKRAFIVNMLKNTGHFPLWNPNFYAGIPTGEGFLGDIFYPLTFALKLIMPLFVVWTLSFIIHPIIAGVGLFLYMKKKIKNNYIALFTAVGYMFTGVILSETYAGHDGRIIVACYLPLLIYFLDQGFTARKLYYFGFAAIASSMMLLSGHIQSSYYAIASGVFYISFLHIDRDYSHKLRNYTWLAGLILGFGFSFINRYIGFGLMALSILVIPPLLDRNFNRISIRIYLSLLFFIIMTAIISAVQYLPLLRFLPETARGVSRGYQYATSWSMGISEIMDMFFPGFTGITFEGTNTYWGENPFKLHLRYIGIIPVFLGVMMMFAREKSAEIKFFTILFVTSIVIALGGSTPFYRLFYNIFPYFNKFRAPDLIFFIASFSIIILAGFALKKPPEDKRIYISGGIVAAVGLLIVIAPGIFESLFSSYINSFNLPAGQIDAKINNLSAALNAVKGTAIVSIIILAGLIYGIVFVQKKYRNYVIIALTLILIIDLWGRLNKFIIAVDPPGQYFSKDSAVQILEEDDELFRVLPLYRNDNYMSLFNIQSVQANHPSPFEDYQKFINNQGSVMFDAGALFQVPERMKFLNLKYIITQYIPSDTAGYDARSKQAILQYNKMFSSMGFNRYKNTGKHTLWKSSDYLPRIYAVNDFIVEDNIEKVLGLIDNNAFDSRHAAVISKKPTIAKTADSLNYSISDIEYMPNSVQFSIETNDNCIAILGDQNYKPWQCFVDGKKSDIYKVNGIFRGVTVTEGNHSIEFRFSGRLQIIALILSVIGLFTVMIIYLVDKFMISKYSKNNVREDI